jgi:hypothetical protein
VSELADLNAVVERNNKIVSRVSRLEVRFEAAGIESKRIYANGRMQVRVWIFVEGVDENGKQVDIDYYPDLITAGLIHAHSGEPLQGEMYQGRPLDGWNASAHENHFAHEMPGGAQSGGGSGGSGGRSTPIEFWVSSSEEGQAQIAAQVTVQGHVYRSNNTVNPDGHKINKSVVIHAERSLGYNVEQFTWQSNEVYGQFSGDLLYRYSLGLYPGGRQIKLLDWESSQYGAIDKYPVLFCDTGLILGQHRPRSFVGVIAPSRAEVVEVYVSRYHPIEVNQRVGELTAVKGIPPKYESTSQVRVDPYHFTVIDEFGNSHELSLEIDISQNEFVLRRG